MNEIEEQVKNTTALLNPPKQPSIAERTHDDLSQSSEGGK